MTADIGELRRLLSAISPTPWMSDAQLIYDLDDSWVADCESHHEARPHRRRSERTTRSPGRGPVVLLECSACLGRQEIKVTDLAGSPRTDAVLEAHAAHVAALLDPEGER